MTVPLRPAVVLVGPPGANVGEVAAWLASRLGAPVVETDSEVARMAGRPVADMIVDDGEEAFRALEQKAALDALRRPGVVALGGGAVLDADVVAALKSYVDGGGRVVFCDVSLAHAVPRLGFNAPRPAGFVNPRSIWQNQMDARRPHYVRVCTDTVDTDARTVTEVGAQVLGLVNQEAL